MAQYFPNYPGGPPIGRRPFELRQQYMGANNTLPMPQSFSYPQNPNNMPRDYYAPRQNFPQQNAAMPQGFNAPPQQPYASQQPYMPQQKPPAPAQDPLVRFEPLTPELLAQLTGGSAPDKSSGPQPRSKPVTAVADSKAAILQNERNAAEYYRLAAQKWAGERVFAEMSARGARRLGEVKAALYGVIAEESKLELPEGFDEALRFAINEEGATIGAISDYLESDGGKSRPLNRLMWRKVADLAYLIAGR